MFSSPQLYVALKQHLGQTAALAVCSTKQAMDTTTTATVLYAAKSAYVDKVPQQFKPGWGLQRLQHMLNQPNGQSFFNIFRLTRPAFKRLVAWLTPAMEARSADVKQPWHMQIIEKVAVALEHVAQVNIILCL
jgi:hypothetical protein